MIRNISAGAIGLLELSGDFPQWEPKHTFEIFWKEVLQIALRPLSEM
jgi:hypothetical protein